MSAQFWKTCISLVAWGGLLFGSLSLANLPGNWEHTICGPWGSGPPLQALTACHLAWLVGLALPFMALWRTTRRTRLRVGVVLIVISLAALMSVIIYQRLTWWAVADPWQRSYFWQRCAFSVAVLVDVPVVQTFVLGVALLLPSHSRRRPNGQTQR